MTDTDGAPGTAAPGPYTGALVDLIAQELQARIISGELPIGAHLAQQRLAEEFGTSRTPVREAIRKLQAQGGLEVRPHRGAVVSGPTVREVREASVIRAELEGLAAEIAAPYLHDQHFARLDEALRMLANSAAILKEPVAGAGSDRIASKEWSCANDLFHEVIQETAGNELLRRSIHDLHRTVPRSLTWSALCENWHLLEENVTEHAVVRDALMQRDAARARSLMREHVTHAGQLVAQWLERRLHIGANAGGQPHLARLPTAGQALPRRR